MALDGSSRPQQQSASIAGALDPLAAFQQAVRKHLPALDGLRGLAVLIVVWHNVSLTGPGFGDGADAKVLGLISNLGWMGVELFFVLSGFLITGILVDASNEPRPLRNFYMRRMLRIFPLYYAVLIVAFIILPALDARPAWSVAKDGSEIWYWTYLVNWAIPIEGGGGGLSHFWSLAVEEQFYLLWPLVVVAVSRPALVVACLILIVSSPLARAWMIHHDFELAQRTAYEFTFARWDALGMGALLAVLVRHRPWLERVIASAPLVLNGALLYMVVYIGVNHNFAPVEQGIAALNQTIASLLFAGILFSGIFPVGAKSSRWQYVLRWSALRNVGKYSYGIYVFHFPIMISWLPLWERYFTEFHRLHPTVDTVARVLVAAVSSYLMAWCSWHVLEQPFLRLKKYFGGKPDEGGVRLSAG